MTSLCPVCQGELRICADNGVVVGECYNCSTSYVLKSPVIPEEGPEGEYEVIEEEPLGIAILLNGAGVWLRPDVAKSMLDKARRMGLEVTRRPDITEDGKTRQVWDVKGDGVDFRNLQEVSV